MSSGLKPKDSMIFVIFSLERIANTCLPVLPSSGQESKDKPKAFRKSFGSSLAKSWLSVMILMQSSEKLLQNSRMPKHSANAQQPDWGYSLQTSALAEPEKDSMFFLSFCYQTRISGSK